jgi:hypothetical protein
MCGTDGTCGCSLEAEEQEAREAAKSRGFKEKMHAPGYACDDTCDADLPDYQRRALVNAGLAPARATKDELDATIASTAIDRAMGGPYGGADGLLVSALLGKSIKPSPAKSTRRTTASDFLRDALEDLEERRASGRKTWTPEIHKRAMEETILAVAGTKTYKEAATAATEAMLAICRENGLNARLVNDE